MKTYVSHRIKVFLPFLVKTFLLLTFVALVSCESEELVNSTESDLEDEVFQKATPVAGKTYYLRNKKSGLHMDVANKSNNNGANVQQWGNASGTHRQWQVISVGSGYFRLKGIDSGKSLTVKDGSNSNGANIESRSYNGSSHQEWQIISVGSGYYRLKSRDSGKSIGVAGGSTSNGANVESRSWNGNDKFRWFFTEVGGTINPPPPPTGGTAASIIGNGWKLNGFSGNLNVGSNDNGLNYADDASKNESHFFFDKDGYAAFRCYPGNPTSGGSSNPRSELREVINGGDGYWNGNTNTEHSMKWRFKIEDLPPSGKLAFGQIHERDDSYDDVIRVQVQGSSGQNSGSVDLRILGYVTEEIEGSGRTIDFNMQMDTEYYFELTMSNGVVRLYNLNNSGNRIAELFESVDIGNANENYFKAGCYLQSTSSSHESSNVYGQVLIKNLQVSPNN
ncbi:RICIN domain-containing protein [uncultured Aquimarina sp.]|uniref:RICIN domain-containing protein n=1 Tax=uncultured Aquimarina sp. TaxID=575652 RepID=UPI0026115363|nr:RICIN domain-containing protein [uncultured Aquimarina sp.]